MGYPAKCCDVKIMQWNQRVPQLNARLPKRGLNTRATTPNLWRGFLMMPPVLITLIGFAGHMALFALIAVATRRGA